MSEPSGQRSIIVPQVRDEYLYKGLIKEWIGVECRDTYMSAVS